jgi:SPW repeat-containing protein
MATQEKERPHLERNPGFKQAAFEGSLDLAPQRRRQASLASSVNLLAGIWLICAPFVLTYTHVHNAFWNDIVLGATVATLACFRVLGAYRQTWISWTNATLGCWLVIAPFVLNYSDVNHAVTNDIVLGLIVLTFGMTSATASRIGVRRR